MKFLKEIEYHLKEETGWGYWFHLFHSFKNSFRLVIIAFKSVVHGILPNVWKAEAPKEVIKMYHEIMKIEHIRKMDNLRSVSKSERYKE